MKKKPHLLWKRKSFVGVKAKTKNIFLFISDNKNKIRLRKHFENERSIFDTLEKSRISPISIQRIDSVIMTIEDPTNAKLILRYAFVDYYGN